MKLTIAQIVAKATELSNDIAVYDALSMAQRAAVNELVLSTSLTEERASALWEVVEPCHMVPEPIDADVLADVLTEDAAHRAEQTAQPVTPELSSVQGVALYTAKAIALEVQDMVPGVRITVQIDPASEMALSYIVTSAKGEAVQMLCSPTTLARLAQIAALMAKGE